MLKGIPSNAFRTIHNTRGSGKNLMLPKVRTETAKLRSLFILMVQNLFNDIPNEMKNLNSVNSIDKLFNYF